MVDVSLLAWRFHCVQVIFVLGVVPRGVTRLDGARGKNTFGAPVIESALPWSKFGAPMVEPEPFGKQIYCTDESTSDIAGTFRRLPQ